MALDLVIRSGTIVTAADTFRGDIGVSQGRIAVLGAALERGEREIDATGHLVMPGGVDAHCHIDEPSYMGTRVADDFASATRAAACGGTTTLVPFANQLPGKTLRAAFEDYHARAADKALIDYAFHMIVSTEIGPIAPGEEIPVLMGEGYRSFKVFMTYPGYMLGDDRILDLMQIAARHGGTILVHAENGHCVHWLSSRLEQAGRTSLRAFGESAPPAVEREATHRAITLAQLTGARAVIVHVSSIEALEQIEWARDRGISVIAETCPQYLVDLTEGAGSPGWEASKFLCSPPPRDKDNVERMWSRLGLGSVHLLSSDHCPYRFEGNDGKRVKGGEPHFRHVPPGLPGLETRLPVLYEEGVLKGRMTAQQFVALTSMNPARTYGLYPRKGSLTPGADADIAIWRTDRPVTIRHADLHDACDYTPFEGRSVGAWPIITISRGEVIWEGGRVSGTPGRGQFLKQGPHG
jgi:dihydropyrimidinase